MALQLRRGTNAERLAMTPLPGELIFVTDHPTAGVPALWIGDLAGTPGGVVAATQSLDDLTDVTITSRTKGDLLTYNGTEWVNDNVIAASSSSNRLVAQFDSSNHVINTALIVRKNYGDTNFSYNADPNLTDGVAIKFELKSTAQGEVELGLINAAYSTTSGNGIDLNFTTTNDDGATYTTPLTLNINGSTVRSNLQVNNEISQSGQNLYINRDSTAADSYLYFKGDTAANIKYDNTDDRFETSKDIIASGVQGGNVQVGIGNDNEVKVGSNNLQLNTDSGYYVQVQRDLRIAGDNLYINSDATATDSYIYLKGTSAAIRYNNSTGFIETPPIAVGGTYITDGTVTTNQVSSQTGQNLTLNAATGYSVAVQDPLTVSGTITATGIITTSADSIHLNTDQSVTDSYLNMFGTDKYLKYTPTGSTYFTLNDSLYIEGGVLQIGGNSILNSVGTSVLNWTGTAVTVPGSLTVSGDLTVNGTTTTLDTTNLVIEDNLILLNKNETGDGVTAGSAGIEVERGTATNAKWTWNETNNWWAPDGDLADQTIWAGNAIIAGQSIGTNSNDFYFNNADGGSGSTSTIHVKRGSNADVALRWNETDDVWEHTRNGSNWFKLPNQNLETTSEPSFYGVTAGLITVGVSTDGTITTTSGNLTLDSSGGTLQVNDNTNITGTLTVSSTATLNGDVNLGNATGDLITVNAATIDFANNTTTTNRGIKGTVGNTDYWQFGGGATADNAGYAEIRTGDDGNEPIYARQYNGGGGGSTRTTTIMDASGNTQLYGDLTVGGTGYIYSNTDLALQLTGADVSVAGNLTVAGNTIKKSSGTDVITFSGTNLTTFAGDIKLGGNTIYDSEGKIAVEFRTTTSIYGSGYQARFNNTGEKNYGVSASYLYLDNMVEINTSSLTTNQNSTYAVLDYFDPAAYRSAKYIVQITNGTTHQIWEGMVIHDGTDIFISAYGDLRTNGNLATMSVGFNATTGYPELRVTAVNATQTKFKATKTYIAV